MCRGRGRQRSPLPLARRSPPGMSHPWCPPRPCPPQRVGFGWLCALPGCRVTPGPQPVTCARVQPAVPSCTAWLVAFPTQNASRLVAFNFFFFFVRQLSGCSFNWSEGCFPFCRCNTFYLFLLHATASQRRYFCLFLVGLGACVRACVWVRVCERAGEDTVRKIKQPVVTRLYR